MKGLIKKLLKENLAYLVEIYSQADMIRMGGTGQLSKAFKRFIPIDKITGLDPEPKDWTDDFGNVRQFEKGEKIKIPIEVIYDSYDDLYYLQNGNHRIKQAKLNGDKYIEAFIQPDRGKIGNDTKLVNEELEYKGISLAILTKIVNNVIKPLTTS